MLGHFDFEGERERAFLKYQVCSNIKFSDLVLNEVQIKDANVRYTYNDKQYIYCCISKIWKDGDHNELKKIL